MPSPDLAQVASAFEQWRQKRPAKKSQTPQHLREQALALREHYKVSHITKSLGLSYSSLSSWEKQQDKKAKPSSKISPTFIPLETAEPPCISQHHREVVITHPNGCCMTIKGNFSLQELIMLMQPPREEDKSCCN